MARFPLNQKKGQVSSLGTGVIALVIASTFLILGIVMIQSLRDTSTVSDDLSGSVNNETVGPVNETGKRVASINQPGFGGFAVVVAINTTSGTVIPSTNYSVNPTTGLVAFTNPNNQLGFNNSNWNVTYTFTYGGEAYSAANKSLIGVGKFADFWEIIVLAIVIAIVLGLIIVAFGRTGRGR